MLSGNTFQFYDQIGSNIEEQGETTDGKRVQKHWRERERTVTNMQSKPGRRNVSLTRRKGWTIQVYSAQLIQKQEDIWLRKQTMIK